MLLTKAPHVRFYAKLSTTALQYGTLDAVRLTGSWALTGRTIEQVTLGIFVVQMTGSVSHRRGLQSRGLSEHPLARSASVPTHLATIRWHASPAA